MNPKKLRKEYMKLVPSLNKVMARVQDKLADLPPGDFTLETNFKPYPSIKKKLEHDEANLEDLSDLVRGRLFFSEQFSFDDVIKLLHEIFGDEIKNVDKKFHRKEEYGLEYHGIMHVDMNINGIRFELQIMPVEFKPYKEFLHKIYDQFRNSKTSDKLTDKQKDLLRKINNKLYRALEEKSLAAREDL